MQTFSPRNLHYINLFLSLLLDVCLNELSEIQYNIIFKAEQQQAHGHCQVCHIIAVYIIGLEETSSLSVL